ncbi:MAG: hypothetical protein Q7S21_01640 [archaeon]|nr:hypothetical protein [archaeon]
MSKKKYKKSIESFDERIKEHREKQLVAPSEEVFHYYEKEIKKFESEKKKKLKFVSKKDKKQIEKRIGKSAVNSSNFK